MQGLYDFIIEQKNAFNDTFITESGLELHGDKRFSQARLSNRIAKITNLPLLSESILKTGYEVMVDPTVYYQHNTKRGRADNTFVQDKEKGLYKIPASMIVLYRETPDHDWKGFENNLMVEFLTKETEEKPKSSILFIPEIKSHEYVIGVAKILYPNNDMVSLGANAGDKVVIRTTEDAEKKNYGLSFWIEGKEFFWVRNVDILAVITEN